MCGRSNELRCGSAIPSKPEENLGETVRDDLKIATVCDDYKLLSIRLAVEDGGANNLIVKACRGTTRSDNNPGNIDGGANNLIVEWNRSTIWGVNNPGCENGGVNNLIAEPRRGQTESGDNYIAESLHQQPTGVRKKLRPVPPKNLTNAHSCIMRGNMDPNEKLLAEEDVQDRSEYGEEETPSLIARSSSGYLVLILKKCYTTAL
jgi:hypothetical protein